MKLSVSILTLENKYELILDDELNKAMFCGKLLKCDITDLKLNILAIIQSWPEKLISTNIIDGIKYEVVYKNGNVKKTYIGINKFPNNFSEFYELITNLQ